MLPGDQFSGVRHAISVVVRRHPVGIVDLRIADAIEHLPNALIDASIHLRCGDGDGRDLPAEPSQEDH